MEDSTLNFQTQDLSILESEVVKRIQEVTMDRSLEGSVNPKCEESSEYDGVIFSKKYLDLVTLILLCWYSDYFAEFQLYVLYEIREYLERNLLFPELAAASQVKEASLLIILSFQKKMSTRKLFGTILNPERIRKVLRKTHLRWIKHPRPRRIIRHRGYRDHGSLRPSHLWIENYDYSFTEEQNLKEELVNEYFDLVASIVHQAGDWLLKNHLFLEDTKEV